jgi:uncharacterized HAD superfamily protein
MKIGIDIDGVVADFVGAFLPMLNSIAPCGFDEIVSHDFAKNIHGLDAQRYQSLWKAQVLDAGLFDTINPIEGSIEALIEWIMGHQIHLITSRPESAREQTISWLRHHKIPYTQVDFARDFPDKVFKLCECDVVLEDELEIARVVESKGVPVILFDYPWNRVGRKITRVSTWDEAKAALMRMVYGTDFGG